MYEGLGFGDDVEGAGAGADALEPLFRESEFCGNDIMRTIRTRRRCACRKCQGPSSCQRRSPWRSGTPGRRSSHSSCT